MRVHEAEHLLGKYGGKSPWVGHCRAVARVAEKIAEALAGDWAVNTEAAYVLGLLHDIGRHRTHHPVRHGLEGYRLLSAGGHWREARACVSHLLHALDPETASRYGLPGDMLPRSLEEKILPLADFLVEGDQPTTLDARFASLRHRYADDAVFMGRLARSEAWTRAFLQRLGPRLPRSAADLAAAALAPG
ncbi:MAG TPA: HD domain-containing protein [Deferrisomatales bacterium]|nr:HD domain-containing protein [Deferrisomatales bacterium]